MKHVRVPSEGPYRQAVIDYLNDVFVTSPSLYWGKHVSKVLLAKFGVNLPKTWKGTAILNQIDRGILIGRFEELSGVKLAAGAAQLLQLGTSLLHVTRSYFLCSHSNLYVF